MRLQLPVWRSRYRWLVIGALAVVIAAITAGSMVMSSHRQSEPQSQKLTFASGWIVMPDSEFKDGSFVPEDVEWSLIQKGLQDVKTLRNWQLCGAELRAEAMVYGAWVGATQHFPRDLPFDDRDPIRDAQRVKKNTEHGQTLERAAKLADSAQIACYQGAPTPQANTVIFESDHRKVLIPDYAVLSQVQPVEFARVTHRCLTYERKELDKLVKVPVDKTVRGMDTTSERSKVVMFVTSQARITMLRAAGLNNC